ARRHGVTPGRELNWSDAKLGQDAACRRHSHVWEHEDIKTIVLHDFYRLQHGFFIERQPAESSERGKFLGYFVEIGIECIDEKGVIVPRQLREPFKRPPAGIVISQQRRRDADADLR